MLNDWQVLTKSLGSINGSLVSGRGHPNRPLWINALEGDKLHLVAKKRSTYRIDFAGVSLGVFWAFRRRILKYFNVINAL
jgi:hypothetical protein